MSNMNKNVSRDGAPTSVPVFHHPHPKKNLTVLGIKLLKLLEIPGGGKEKILYVCCPYILDNGTDGLFGNFSTVTCTCMSSSYYGSIAEDDLICQLRCFFFFFPIMVFMPMCKVKILTEGITSVEPWKQTHNERLNSLEIFSPKKRWLRHVARLTK